MKTSRFVCLSVFLSLALVIPVIGAAQNSAVPESGTIRGTITRAGNGEPVSGATVTLQGGNADPQAIQSLLNQAAANGVGVTPAPGASTQDIVQAIANAAQAAGRAQLTVANIQSQLASLSGRTAPTTTTDRDGRFTFANVTPGPYTVRVQKEGFFGKPEGGNYPPTGAIHVSVAAKEIKDANLPLIPGALIGGRVFGADGQLLSNAIVWALRVSYQLGHAVLEGQVSKIADDRGEFRLFWVPPGDYYLTAEPPRPAPTPGITAAAPAGQGIKTFYPGTTAVTEAKVVSIKGGEETLGMDIGIRPISLYKVSGQVSSLIPPPAAQTAAPVVNAAVLVLLSPDGNAPDDTKQVGTVPLVPQTGRFEISLLPGVYDLFARVPDAASQAAGGAPQAWGRARLDVRDADINNIVITIPPSVEIKGTVNAPGGRIPSALRVQLISDEPSAAKIPAYQQVNRRAVTVSADGAFSLAAVPEGRFRVSGVAGLPQDMYVADVRQAAQSVFDSGFDVNARNTNPVEIVLGTGAGTVNGIVLDGPMKVVPGATVVLVPETRRRSNRALYLTTASDASGRFTLRGVAPGDYKLFAWESIPPFAHVNAAFMAKHEDRGKTVHVGQSGTVTAELTIIPAISK
jgi:hypothetical protein